MYKNFDLSVTMNITVNYFLNIIIVYTYQTKACGLRAGLQLCNALPLALCTFTVPFHFINYFRLIFFNKSVL